MSKPANHRPVLRLLALLLAGSGAASAQQQTQAPKPRAPRAATRSLSIDVHEAWLQEVLDLDFKGALQAYDRISKHAPRNQPERWLAVTRLAELRRLGIEPLEPGPQQTAPAAVKKALSELEAGPNLDELLRARDPDLQLPPLHPATQQVQDWVRNQIGPTVEERLRLSRMRSRNTEGGAPTNRPDRWYAYDILRVELQNGLVQAQALRTLYFENWQPPTWQGDPAEQLALVEQRLQAWIDVETSSAQRIMLARLEVAIKQRAETGPELALAFVARMPLYAERLLLPAPVPDDKGSPNPGDGGRSGQR